ncbi:hypothetical protein EON65_09900 [archaeon]|nr:MAG: hypothetical protein EON65_09900 [archaeon]
MHFTRTLQYAGFVVTPVLGAVLSAAAPHLHFSLLTRYNFPALFLVLSALVCIYLLHTDFQDVPRPLSPASNDTARLSAVPNTSVSRPYIIIISAL